MSLRKFHDAIFDFAFFILGQELSPVIPSPAHQEVLCYLQGLQDSGEVRKLAPDNPDRFRAGPGLTTLHININTPFTSRRKQGCNLLSAASGTSTGLR